MMFNFLVLLSGPLAPPRYFDPGSGSILLQILLAAVLGIGLAVRASWGRIKGLFGKKKSDDAADEDADN